MITQRGARSSSQHAQMIGDNPTRLHERVGLGDQMTSRVEPTSGHLEGNMSLLDEALLNTERVNEEFKSLPAPEIAAYLIKDEAIRKKLASGVNPVDLATLRYGLSTQAEIDLALTDTAAILHGYKNSTYYQRHWASDEVVRFLNGILDAVAQRDPNNIDILCLRPRVTALSGNMGQVTKEYESLLTSLKEIAKEERSAYVPDLVDICRLMRTMPGDNAAEQERLIQATIAVLDVSASNGMKARLARDNVPGVWVRSDAPVEPYDTSGVAQLYGSRWPLSDVIHSLHSGQTTATTAMPEWGLRLSILMTMHDARGLNELSQTMAGGDGNLSAITRAFAHCAAGRASVGIPALEKILQNPSTKSIPSLSNSACFLLGTAYCETGQIEKAKECLGRVDRAMLCDSDRRYLEGILPVANRDVAK
jgi:hypothetical protein